MHHHTENEERGVNLSFLNVSRPGEFSRVEPQAPLLEVAFRQSLHVSGLRPCSPQKHKTLISQLDPSWFGLRPFPCVKGSYLRLDFKGPESMPDGMGHGTQRHNTTATLMQTTCNSAGAMWCDVVPCAVRCCDVV